MEGVREYKRVSIDEGNKKGAVENLFVFVFIIIVSTIFLLGLGGCEGKSEGKGTEGEETCPVWYKDEDGDGYTDGITRVSCEQLTGYVSSATSGDCNDKDKDINPAKAEICDGKDNNCDGQVDEGVFIVFYKDEDQDGYTDGTTIVGCSAPVGYVSTAKSGDCNDNDKNINPAKTEICDGKDNDCNGVVDEGFNVGQSCSVGIGECAREGQLICKADGSGTECNATPGAPTTEICDGKDNDCDGQTDENNICSTKLGAGYLHTCAIKQDGSLWCWGDNYYGQLGDGTYTDRYTPVQVYNMTSGVSVVSLGGAHTCAIKQNGSLWCWGRNGLGQLGDGTYTDKNTPVQIMSEGVVAVSLGLFHTCAVKQDGSLWCWGDNYYGQLGDGTWTWENTPVRIMSEGVSAISLGSDHTCAIKQNGSLWCWGRNDLGQLGDGTYTDKNTPVQIMSEGVVSVALGGFHTCAIKQDGSLWCWGDNYYGQLGDGTWTGKNTPVRIMSEGVSAVALGAWHTCAIKQDGSLWCWGLNYYGQLGDGTWTGKNTPVRIMSEGVIAVSSAGEIICDSNGCIGGGHTCAIKQDGSLWCWGRNEYGQVGDGTNVDKNTPTYIMNLGSGGGSAPYISFGERFDEFGEESERAKYGCSSASFVYHTIYSIFPVFILFALRKFKLKSNK